MGLVGQDLVLSPTQQPRPAARPLFYCSLAARKRHVCRCSTLIGGKRGGARLVREREAGREVELADFPLRENEWAKIMQA